MQEVRRFTWCDVCTVEAGDDAPTHEPAETFTVAIDGAAPMTIDLCERHHKTLVAPLVELLANHGYRESMTTTPAGTGRHGQKPKGARDMPCLWCDMAYASSTGLGGHLVAVHGFPANDTTENRATIGSVYDDGRCPVCGAAVVSVTALGVHLFRQHKDVPGTVAGVYGYARAQGDPHGVVAKVVAKAPGGRYKAPRRRS